MKKISSVGYILLTVFGGVCPNTEQTHVECSNKKFQIVYSALRQQLLFRKVEPIRPRCEYRRIAGDRNFLPDYMKMQEVTVPQCSGTALQVKDLVLINSLPYTRVALRLQKCSHNRPITGRIKERLPLLSEGITNSFPTKAASLSK